MYIVMKPDELQHHGVKGMRWGVRKDMGSSGGTKTKQNGSSRFSSVKKKYRSTRNAWRNLTGSRKSAALKKYRGKNIDGMSDEDLKNAVYRMNMEKQYRSLTKLDFYRGKRIVDTMHNDQMAFERAKASGKRVKKAATIYGAKKAAQIASL